jgi:hypothetical protein
MAFRLLRPKYQSMRPAVADQDEIPLTLRARQSAVEVSNPESPRLSTAILVAAYQRDAHGFASG